MSKYLVYDGKSFSYAETLPSNVYQVYDMHSYDYRSTVKLYLYGSIRSEDKIGNLLLTPLLLSVEDVFNGKYLNVELHEKVLKEILSSFRFKIKGSDLYIFAFGVWQKYYWYREKFIQNEISVKITLEIRSLRSQMYFYYDKATLILDDHPYVLPYVNGEMPEGIFLDRLKDLDIYQNLLKI